MPKQKIIGVRTTRSEGLDKVSGRTIYATDIVLPNMLWAKVLRSPISYGRITKIDTSKAAGLPGVRAVVTGADLKNRLIGRRIYDIPILADGIVRFIGEKMAAVAAESEAIAEPAVDLIDIEYEELEPLHDPQKAAKPSATLIHPNVQSYRGLLHGGMSIGEPPVVPIAAAIANAVHDAIGVRIYDLPIMAERVFSAIKDQPLPRSV